MILTDEKIVNLLKENNFLGTDNHYFTGMVISSSNKYPMIKDLADYVREFL